MFKLKFYWSIIWRMERRMVRVCVWFFVINDAQFTFWFLFPRLYLITIFFNQIGYQQRRKYFRRHFPQKLCDIRTFHIAIAQDKFYIASKDIVVV
jgi:hypothetical protein